MKNQKKQLIILVCLLVFLVLAYFGLSYYNDAQEKKETEESTITITDFSSEEVVAFTYDYDEIEYSFSKNDDVWIYEGDTTLDMDEDVIETMLETAGSLLGEYEIDEYESLDTYGLDVPIKTIKLTMSDNTTLTIYVGDYNSIVGLYYVMVDEDSTLYMADSTILSMFEASYTDMIVEEIESVETTEE